MKNVKDIASETGNYITRIPRQEDTAQLLSFLTNHIDEMKRPVFGEPDLTKDDFSEDYVENILIEDFQNNPLFFIFSKEDNSCKGVISYTLDLQGSHRFSPFLPSPYRKQGIMLEVYAPFLEKAAQDLDLKRMFGSTERTNKSMIRLFRNAGFKCIGEFQNNSLPHVWGEDEYWFIKKFEDENHYNPQMLHE